MLGSIKPHSNVFFFVAVVFVCTMVVFVCTMRFCQERKGMEGSLFVVRRKSHPHFMVRFRGGVMQTGVGWGGSSVVLSPSPSSCATCILCYKQFFVMQKLLLLLVCCVCSEELGDYWPARV